ncbi:hypothetical protein MYXO_03459 [Myxococcaceae bacterium]|nr:hypothetical protein MYXO_03459 [Myxococcaceae bacterium]
MFRSSNRMNRFSVSWLVLGLALSGSLFAGSAAATSSPPSWMPMTMLTVSLDGSNHLQVVDQSTMPAAGGGVYPAYPVALAIDSDAMGKPNLAATSFASFDPTKPWSVLQGKAWSRQLGWWAGSGTGAPAALAAAVEAAYGVGAGIWIELVSQSEGLETYLAIGKYGVNVDNGTNVDPLANGYAGIFGTAGSSTRWRWDTQMDHNTYAVPLAYLAPGAVYSATYRVYVGDAAGDEIAAAVGASTLETWTWQAPAIIPEPGTALLLLAGLAGMGFASRRDPAS